MAEVTEFLLVAGSHTPRATPTGGGGVRDLDFPRSRYDGRRSAGLGLNLLPQVQHLNQLTDPAARAAYARGREMFGLRRWVLMERNGEYRAYEQASDAPRRTDNSKVVPRVNEHGETTDTDWVVVMEVGL